MLKLENEFIQEIKESTDNYPLSSKSMTCFIGDLLSDYFEDDEVYYDKQDYYEAIYDTISDAKNCKIVITTDKGFLKSLEFYFDFEYSVYIYIFSAEYERETGLEKSGYLCKVVLDGKIKKTEIVSKEALSEVLLDY